MIFPALSRSRWRRTLAANATANLLRNLWAYVVIFCGHFPDGAEKFTADVLEHETRAEWYLRQMLGAANFKAGPLLAFSSGNLCYQIEHHLFPDLPSNRYAQIAVRVRALCDKYDLPYTTGSLVHQYLLTLRTIHKLALPDRFLTATCDDAPETASERKFGTGAASASRIGWPDNRAANGVAGARTPTPTLTNRLGVALIGAPILAGSGQTPACPGSTAAPFAGSPLVVTGAGSADGLAVSGGGVIPCMAAVSRARKLPISPIALIIGAGNTTVVFFSTPSSASVCRFRSCRASGCAIIVSDASPRAAAAIDSPSAAIILARFSRSASACRAIARFMLSGNWISFSSTRCHFHAPLEGRHIEDLLDVGVDDVGFGERLVQGVLTDHLAQRRLRDLVDGGVDVLDGDHRFHRVDDAEVGDCGNVDADVVAGDDAL